MKSSEDQYKSKEELYFSWYLEELKDKGYIHEYYYEPWTITLFEKEKGYPFIWHKKMKTKVKEVDRVELEEHVYTPDFVIKWTEKSKGIFIDDEINGCVERPPFVTEGEELGGMTSTVDVKSQFDQNNMNRVFSINRKWMWSQEHIFVNKIVPHKLFKRTFTPDRYLYTDRSGKKRKLKFTPRSLDDYENSMKTSK